MAYAIVERLQKKNESELLYKLQQSVEPSRRLKKKLHDVWEPSSDWKDCRSIAFANQKAEYMHQNPCAGKWTLSKSPYDYKQSSAGYYFDERQGLIPIKTIMEMQDNSLE